MTRVERGHTGSEQLPVLWTWLLEHYVPVAHIVADLDEMEAFVTNESADNKPVRHAPDTCCRLIDRRAA